MKFKLLLAATLSFFLGCSAVSYAVATPTVTPVPTYQSTPTVNDNGNNMIYSFSALAQLQGLVTSIYTAINTASTSSQLPTAWGQCVIASNVPTINSSFNIASAISYSAGSYAVTFANAMSDTLYAVQVQGEYANNSLNIGIPSINTRATTGFNIQFLNLSNTSSVSTACTPTAMSFSVLGR